MPNAEGFAKGVAAVNYPGVDNGVPLLNSFYFRFQRPKSTAPVDNHINMIRVLPAGRFVDLSPNAELPSSVAPGKIDLTYADEELDDKKDNYFYKVAHHNLLNGARRFQFRDVGCAGKCVQVLPTPPGPIPPGVPRVFVLVGFKLYFIGNRDRHMDTISVLEDGGKLTVEFKDRHVDSNDTFGYIVDYALVSTLGQNILLGEESGTTTGGARVRLPRGPKVLRGFRFDFGRDDNHLREVGVVMGDDRLEVFYADKDPTDEPPKDRFNWLVRWASITPQVVGQ